MLCKEGVSFYKEKMIEEGKDIKNVYKWMT